AGWKFLLNLRSNAWVLFLGPSWGAAPVSLARSAAHVVVLDGSVERLRLVHEQAAAAGLENLTFARVVDPLRLPLPDGSVNLVVAPGLVEWFTAVAGERVLSAACGRELLGELRRVLAPRCPASAPCSRPSPRSRRWPSVCSSISPRAARSPTAASSRATSCAPRAPRSSWPARRTATA